MPQPLPSLLLIKEQLLTGHDAHYAGGIHLFRCFSQQLSTSGQFCAVHTFSLASKGVVLHHAVTHNLLHCLQTRTTSCGVEFITLKQHNVLVDHFVVRPEPLLHGKHSNEATAATSHSKAVPTEEPSQPAAALLSVVAETSHQLTCQGHGGHVLLDIDSLQHAQVEICRVPGRGLSGQAATAGLSVQTTITGVEQSGRRVETGGSGAHAGHQLPFMLALALVLQQQQQQQLPNMTLSSPSAQHDRHPSTAQDCTHSPQRVQQQQQQKSRSPWHLLAVVQNIHHLPFGPSGTSPRSPLVLQAWQSVTGILTVSHFVRSYLQQHAIPLLPQLQLQTGRVLVTHPCAFRVWGDGPFEDLGSLAAERLWGPATTSTDSTVPADTGSTGTAGIGSTTPANRGNLCPAITSSTGPADACSTGPPTTAAGRTGVASAPCGVFVGQQQQQQQQQRGSSWQHAPVVGMLKLTREKGIELFLALPEHLPALQFKAVCADPGVRQQAAIAGCSNVQLVPPAADVSTALADMSLVLVPSVLHEAFGMVVLDAMLHGLPVIVAAAGALPEAAAGSAAAVLPVNMVSFPRVHQPGPASDNIRVYTAAAAVTASAAASKDVATAAEAGAAAAGAGSLQQSSTCTCTAAGCTAIDRTHSSSQCTCQPSTGCCSCWLADQRSWEHRQYACLQQQHIDSWSSAVLQVLHNREAYMVARQRSRAAAHSILQQSEQQFEALLSWLQLSPTGFWP